MNLEQMISDKQIKTFEARGLVCIVNEVNGTYLNKSDCLRLVESAYELGKSERIVEEKDEDKKKK